MKHFFDINIIPKTLELPGIFPILSYISQGEVEELPEETCLLHLALCDLNRIMCYRLNKACVMVRRFGDPMCVSTRSSPVEAFYSHMFSHLSVLSKFLQVFKIWFFKATLRRDTSEPPAWSDNQNESPGKTLQLCRCPRSLFQTFAETVASELFSRRRCRRMYVCMREIVLN